MFVDFTPRKRAIKLDTSKEIECHFELKVRFESSEMGGPKLEIKYSEIPLIDA